MIASTKQNNINTTHHVGIKLESALIWSGEAQKVAATYFDEENEKEEKM